jgi:hypothetical protein
MWVTTESRGEMRPKQSAISVLPPSGDGTFPALSALRAMRTFNATVPAAAVSSTNVRRPSRRGGELDPRSVDTRAVR